MSKYKELFLQETGEHLQGISTVLLHLEGDQQDAAAIDNLFRHFHSIKGMAASMGYEAVASLSHQLEDVLDAVRKKRIAVSQEVIDTLLKGADTLQVLINMVAEDKPPDAVNTDDVASMIKAVLIEEGKSTQTQGAPPSVKPPLQKLSLPATMKVEGKLFDNFMTIVGELFTVGSRLKELTKKSYPVEFHDAVRRLVRTIEGLNHTVITARMIPFDNLTQNLPRIVRDMCKNSGKEVDLTIQGADVRLDRAVLEHLTDPLVHIIRNAIDHGIETPEERMRIGKPAKGTITIVVARQRDNIIIEITDDGKGIDVNRLREKAVQSGFSAEALKGMTENEILNLVCMPGLSLASRITETSGRGVGMDVVKGNVESIGGRLEISSRPNIGSKILLELPVTIAIIKVLLISLSDEFFALPLSKVLKVLDVNRADMKSGAAGPSFLYNGIEVPVIDLRKILMMEPVEEKDPAPTVIVDLKDRILGIAVDSFVGEIDAYIKPLSQPMARMSGVIGVTVLGDGRPVFLLDPAAVYSYELSGMNP